MVDARLEPHGRARSFGRLTPEQLDALRPLVRGRRFRDYGCGNMYITALIAGLGARHIEAIDAEKHVVPATRERLIKFRRTTFASLPLSQRGAIVSWPWKEGVGLLRHLQHAPTIIYLGKNTDGVACGHLRFWKMVIRRRVLEYIPDARSTLIIYGEPQDRSRLMPEEYAAMGDVVRGFAEVHRHKSYDINQVVSPTEGLFDELLSALAGLR
jgi:hypothetical protein